MTLSAHVRALAASAATLLAGTEAEQRVRAICKRLDEPFRLAIAGKVKAGKSTLLNALVGDELAPTDAGECTKVVTWYGGGLRFRVRIHERGGEVVDARFARDGGVIDVDLDRRSPDEIEWIEIECPTPALRDMTIIDTPGIASLANEVSMRTIDFLTPEDDEPRAADGVLYLMRHAHASDVRFLESFHDDEIAQAAPINTIGVVSRADELGAGKPDSMESADRIAARYRNDPRLRRLCLTVVPVSGLLAVAGLTLREDEYRALGLLAGLAADDLRWLATADRFVSDEFPVSLGVDERRHLLSRLGLFGVRLAVSLIGSGSALTASALADELVARSGLMQLREVVRSQFGARGDVLRSRSALLSIESLVRMLDGDRVRELEVDLERIWAGAHELAELRVLSSLRSGALPLRDEEVEEAERLLGALGASPAARAGLDEAAPAREISEVLIDTVARWRRRADSPVSAPVVAQASRVLVRSCEAMVTAMSAAG